MDDAERKRLVALVKRYSDENKTACELAAARLLLDEDPHSGFALLHTGIALSTLARYDEAIQALRRGLRHCSEGRKHLFHGHIGHAYLRRGRRRLAERHYRRAIEANPDDTMWHVFLGAMFSSHGDLEGAAVSFRSATRCDSGDLDEAWLNLGRVLRALERYDEARACFRRAVSFSPDFEPARTDLADCNELFEEFDGGA